MRSDVGFSPRSKLHSESIALLGINQSVEGLSDFTPSLLEPISGAHYNLTCLFSPQLAHKLVKACPRTNLKTIKKIFTNDIKDIQDFQIVFQLIQGMVQMILNLVQQEILTGQCEKSKLLCCTYLLYVALYEEAYKFNKNNQMTFVEITANVEKYGYEQLTKNLNNQILNYNKVQTQKRQRR